MLGKSKVYIKKLNEAKESDLEIIGREALQYAKMFLSKIPAQEGFIINTFAFDDFLLYNQLVQSLVQILKEVKPFIKESAAKASSKITNLILNGEIPPQLIDQILQEYSNLSNGKTLPYIVLEPSHIIKENFISKTEEEIKLVDIRGEEDLINSLKLLWSSLFSTEALETRVNSYYKGEISMAATVKKMCANEISGKVYSLSANNTDDEYTIEIEAYFGMENVEEDSKKFSDLYKVDIEKMHIVEKRIFPQERMLVRRGKATEDKSRYFSIEISPEWHRKQKISDEIIYQITGDFLKVEEIFKRPIQVSWCVEAGNVIFTDIKNLEIKKLEDYINQGNLFTNLEESVKEENSEKKAKPELTKLQKEIELMLKEEKSNDTDNIQDLINKTTKEVALLEKKNVYKPNAAAKWSAQYDLRTEIYLDISKLNSSNLNSIDYFDGTFFDGTEIILQHDYLPEMQFKNSNNYNVLIDSYSIDITVAAQNSSPKDMIYQFANITDLEYRMLGIKDEGDLFIGDERFINKPEAIVAEVHAINKSKEQYKTNNISIAFPGIRNVSNLQGAIRILSLHGLKKSPSLKYYADLSVPSFLYDIEELPENLIDGLIINYDSLLKLSVFRKEVKPSDHDILIKMLHNVAKEGRSKKFKCGVLVYDFTSELIEKLAHCKFDFFIFGNIPEESCIKAINKVEQNI